MKKCPKCSKIYDDSWKICLKCNLELSQSTGNDAGEKGGYVMKKCPYCSEKIQDSAVKCRFCGEWLDKAKSRPLEPASFKFPKIWIGYLLAALSAILQIRITMLPAGSPQQMLFGLGIVPLVLAGTIYWCICVYKIHKSVLRMANNHYPISPARAVWFGFIPIYNMYWMFKWPGEIINLINSREETRKLNRWIPGLCFLLAVFASYLLGALWLIINFAVLAYLIKQLKRALKAKPEAISYKDQSTQLPVGAIIGIILLCLLPILGLLAAIAIPNFIMARQAAQASACTANLRAIETAKQIRAADNNMQEDSVIGWADLVPKYLKQKPVCYSGGQYVIGTLRTPATCSKGNNNTVVTRDDHLLKK